MLNVTFERFKEKAVDTDRDHLIFISLPIGNGIMTVRLSFQKLVEINFYYEQLFEISKLLQIKVDSGIVKAYEKALRKLDFISIRQNSTENTFLISKSIFGKFNGEMFSVGYSLKLSKLDTESYDNQIVDLLKKISNRVILENS